MKPMASFVRSIVMMVVVASGLLMASSSDYPGYKPVSHLSDFKSKFKIASANIQTINSDFRQEKVLSALTEKIVSQGKFWFKRNNKVRMDYTKPFVYRLIINGDKMLVKDSQKENQVNVKSNKLFQQINKIIIDCLQGSVLESRDFQSKVFENDDTYLLELSPLQKNLKDFFQTIVIIIDKKDHAVKSLELNEPSGDKTVMMFSNKVINGSVPDEVFAF